MKNDSTAASLGLKAEDVVTHIAGRPVKNSVAESLDHYIATNFFNDEEITVAWLREGNESSANAKLTNKKLAAAEMPEAGKKSLAEAGMVVSRLGDTKISQTMRFGGGTSIVMKDGNLRIVDDAGELIYEHENFSMEKHLDNVPDPFRDVLKMGARVEMIEEGNALKAGEKTGE